MARMSADKSKKTASQKEGVTKATKLPRQSKKTTQVLVEQNGSASDYTSQKEEPFEPVLPIGSQEDVRREPVSDTLRPEHVSEGMNADSGNASEPDSAMHHRIAEHAFMLFQESGCQHGRDWADWFEAERQMTQTRSSSRDD